MADNFTSPSSKRTPMASDVINGVNYPRVKFSIGADGSATDLAPGQKTMANSVPVVLASDQTVLPAKPFAAMIEGGLTELVGADEQVDNNEFSASVLVPLANAASGEILSFAFFATEAGSGAIQDSAGKLIILDADPETAVGDTALSAAEWKTVIGIVNVTTNDWIVDANGGAAFIYSQPIPFHSLSALAFVWLHKDATSLNDAAGDDEKLEFNFWYRRDS